MKVRDVLILEDAANDLEDGRFFYSQAEIRVGEYFWDSLISDIESLVIYAGLHNKRYGFHLMFARRFPYAIFYYVKNQVAYVVAVLPMRRDPSWIRKRLKERN
ncbi:MAG: hypothetical protein K9H64_18845 [Bacteroidales bacterium]|nr:hypothetical protein [Bacteroidales bacterium]MCF8458074.1 hypothetical protein [Bacteroidales bacterium]